MWEEKTMIVCAQNICDTIQNHFENSPKANVFLNHSREPFIHNGQTKTAVREAVGGHQTVSKSIGSKELSFLGEIYRSVKAWRFGKMQIGKSDKRGQREA